MPNKIQSRDYSRGGGIENILHISVCELNGKRNAPYLNEDGDRRKLNLNWFDEDWNDYYRFAGVRNSSHFSPAFAGEFCFTSCPFQPPSIFPISSKCRDRTIYFLLSSDFVSHKTISKTFNVSNFLMATDTYERFSSFGRKLAIDIDSIISTKRVSIL